MYIDKISNTEFQKRFMAAMDLDDTALTNFFTIEFSNSVSCAQDLAQAFIEARNAQRSRTLFKLC